MYSVSSFPLFLPFLYEKQTLRIQFLILLRIYFSVYLESIVLTIQDQLCYLGSIVLSIQDLLFLLSRIKCSVYLGSIILSIQDILLYQSRIYCSHYLGSIVLSIYDLLFCLYRIYCSVQGTVLLTGETRRTSHFLPTTEQTRK